MKFLSLNMFEKMFTVELIFIFDFKNHYDK